MAKAPKKTKAPVVNDAQKETVVSLGEIKVVIVQIMKEFITEERGNKVTKNNVAGLLMEVNAALDGEIRMKVDESNEQIPLSKIKKKLEAQDAHNYSESLRDLAERKILDESNDEYSEQNLVELYNLAIKEIVNLVPSSSSQQRAWKMAPTTRQAIPADAVGLVDVISNMGTDGLTPGAAIRETSLKIMKALLPGWEADTPSAITQHFMRIPESKTAFFIYPKSDGTNFLLADIVVLPPLVLWDAGDLWKSAVIGVDDTYSHAVINGMVYIAYDDDSDLPGNTPRSEIFYRRFLQDLGLRDQRMVTRKQRKIAQD